MDRVLLLQLDGKNPNLALMRLAAHHRGRGDTVELRQAPSVGAVERRLGDAFDKVYASAIFERSRPIADRLKMVYPDAVVGGSGVDELMKLEHVGVATRGPLDYGDYDARKYPFSIGFTQRGCRLKCSFCLSPETLILTADGLKEIANVVVGDMVLTHLGRYRKVIATMSRPYEGVAHRLRSGALSELFSVVITPEHPVYTRHVSCRSGGKKLTSFNWVDAGKIKAESNQNRSREVYAYPRTRSEAMPRGGVAPGADWLPLNRDAMTLIGWYLAEGYLTTAIGRGYHRTTFCLGHSEEEIAHGREIVEAARVIGIKASAWHVKIGVRVSIDNVKLARWLLEQFGTGASRKRIPLWVRLLPCSLIRPLVEAWTKGYGWGHIKKGTPTCKVTTVSPDLAVGLRELTLKMGYRCTINRIKNNDVIQGRKVNVKPGFCVIYSRPEAAEHCVVSDERYVYQRAYENIEEHYTGNVHNIEVEEDNSYCTPAFALHNCKVPRMEGRPRPEKTIAEIWRGEPFPRWIVLLDNDFFGVPDWHHVIDELRAGKYRVSFNQGINARMLTDEAAAAIASVDYRDDSFKVKKIYTAWDNLPDEDKLFRGMQSLVKYGVKPDHITVYVLVGYDHGTRSAAPALTEADLYRHRKLREFGARPYPMPFVRTRQLVGFQRWVIGAYDKRVGWGDWERAGYSPRKLGLSSGTPMLPGLA